VETQTKVTTPLAVSPQPTLGKMPGNMGVNLIHIVFLNQKA